MADPADVQKLIDDINDRHEKQSGHSRLWGWFSMSYASFVVLPRILMHEMPDDWQKRMAILLEEFNGAFPNDPIDECRVQCVRDGKLSKWPDWLLNYRYPDRAEVEKCRSPH